MNCLLAVAYKHLLGIFCHGRCRQIDMLGGLFFFLAVTGVMLIIILCIQRFKGSVPFLFIFCNNHVFITSCHKFFQAFPDINRIIVYCIETYTQNVSFLYLLHFVLKFSNPELCMWENKYYHITIFTR